MIDILISTHILLAFLILLTIMVLVTSIKNKKDVDIELDNIWDRLHEIDTNLSNLINQLGKNKDDYNDWMDYFKTVQ